MPDFLPHISPVQLRRLCVNTVLQITCAIMLSEVAGKKFKRITQSVMFLPYFTRFRRRSFQNGWSFFFTSVPSLSAIRYVRILT